MSRDVDFRVPVHASYESAAEALRADPRAVIAPASSELRMGAGGSTVGRAVTLTVGTAGVTANEIRIPVSWHAQSHPELFPVLTGELRLAPRGRADVELSLAGSYRAPLGLAGELGDRMVGHRVAEHTIRGFLDVVARQLTARVTEQAESKFGRAAVPADAPSSEYRDEHIRRRPEA